MIRDLAASSGHIYAGGHTEEDFAIVRLSGDGAIDENFAGQGYLITDVGGQFDKIFSIAFDAQNRLVATGDGGSITRNVTVRYTPQWQPDSTFHFDGIRYLNLGFSASANGYGKKVIPQGGNLFVASQTGPADIGGIQFSPEGDLTPDIGVIDLETSGGVETIQDAALQSSGKVVLLGWYQDFFQQGNYDLVLTRLDFTCQSQIDASLMLSGDTIFAVDHPDYTYEWFKCDAAQSLIPGANDSFYLPAESGEYAVRITNGGGCTDTSFCLIVDVMTNASSLSPYAKAAVIYPNPTQDFLQVEYGDQLPQRAQFLLFDAMGRPVLHTPITPFQERLSISHLPAGVYTL